MTTTYAIANRKGGTGKTTTTQNLGAALSREGLHVLLVDFDPQCDLTTAFEESADMEAFEPYNVVQIAGGTEKWGGYDLVTGDPLLAVRQATNLETLEERIRYDGSLYDVVLVDCPPSLSEVALSGLGMADRVIIPTNASFLSVNGIRNLIGAANAVNEAGGEIEAVKVLITLYEQNGAAREMEGQIREAYPTYGTRIRKNVAISYAQAAGVDIFRYDKSCNGAQDYTRLAQEIAEEL